MVADVQRRVLTQVKLARDESANIHSPEAQSLHRLSGILRDSRNIDLSLYKKEYVQRRIVHRTRLQGCRNLEEYVRLLERQSDEIDHLVDSLSIKVSSFFRNPEVFEAIATTIFDSWMKQGNKKTRYVWSCACAHGQEPYSLSLLWEHWKARHSHKETLIPELRITASDMDREAVAQAATGVYDRKQLATIPEKYRSFFTVNDTTMRIPADVRNRIRWSAKNALTPGAQPRFDLILCRNFLIFLERDRQAGMFQVLHRFLAEDGFLVLGRTESIWREEKELFHCVDLSNRIYRKNNRGQL